MAQRTTSIFFTTALLALVGSPAVAQVRPMSSGASSFNEPEMRRYGSGFYRPNQPGQYDRPDDRNTRQPYDGDER